MAIKDALGPRTFSQDRRRFLVEMFGAAASGGVSEVATATGVTAGVVIDAAKVVTQGLNRLRERGEAAAAAQAVPEDGGSGEWTAKKIKASIGGFGVENEEIAARLGVQAERLATILNRNPFKVPEGSKVDFVLAASDGGLDVMLLPVVVEAVKNSQKGVTYMIYKGINGSNEHYPSNARKLGWGIVPAEPRWRVDVGLKGEPRLIAHDAEGREVLVSEWNFKKGMWEKVNKFVLEPTKNNFELDIAVSRWVSGMSEFKPDNFTFGGKPQRMEKVVSSKTPFAFQIHGVVLWAGKIDDGEFVLALGVDNNRVEFVSTGKPDSTWGNEDFVMFTRKAKTYEASADAEVKAMDRGEFERQALRMVGETVISVGIVDPEKLLSIPIEGVEQGSEADKTIKEFAKKVIEGMGSYPFVTGINYSG